MGKKRVVQKKGRDLNKRQQELIDTPAVRAANKIGIKEGRIYIKATYNNTLLTLTDKNGDTLYSSSAGRMGFKGTRKATPFAASKVGNIVAAAAEKIGIERLKVFVKGIGGGRDSALRAIVNRDVEVIKIIDSTPIPHNGCRLPKPRRV